MDLKDSKTKVNLLRAFAGESQARNRYDMASAIAKKEKLNIIESLFTYTANQEKAHAKVFYDILKPFNGENVIINDAGYPIGAYDSTLQILKASAYNEHEEHNTVYSSFAKVAEEEGFSEISNVFSNIASVEKIHGDRFDRYTKELENGSLFKKEQDVQWICTNCGFIYEGKEAPMVCPVCQHPQGYYILFKNSLFE